MRSIPLRAELADGRTVAVLHTPGGTEGAVVVIAAGYGQDMAKVGALACWLAHLGIDCYRFDPVDHVGISDGSVRQYTPTGHALSLESVIDLAVDRHRRPVTVLAISLANPIALRVAARRNADPTKTGIEQIVAIAGVVAMRKTIAVAMGEDYKMSSVEALPKTVRFADHEIDPRWMLHDNALNRWGELEDTVAELQQLSCPVTNVVGTLDTWVDLVDVRRAMAGNQPAVRNVVEVDGMGHEMPRGRSGLRSFLELVASEIARHHMAIPFREGPRFADIVSFLIEDRNLIRSLSARSCTEVETAS